MPGRTFIHNPGPTNIPDSVLEAFRRPSVDFGSADFANFVNELWIDLEQLFDAHRVMAYPAVGHGAWEATLVNLVEPGQKLLLPETGLFSIRWADMARKLGFDPQPIAVDYRRAPDPALIHAALVADTDHELVGVFVAQTETSTGTLADIAAIREALDSAGHPGLLVVDAIAGFATDPVPLNELGIDVVLASSQKGLMMPPGMSFSALSEKAVQHNKTVGTPRYFWSWDERIDPQWVYQRFCGTPPIQHLFALRAAVDLLLDEGGLDAVCARHRRFADAVRVCVETWGEGFAVNATHRDEQASAVTCVLADGIVDQGVEISDLIALARDRYNVSIAPAMLDMADRAFRIGHLGDLNEPMLIGALGGLECTFRDLEVGFTSGLAAATAVLVSERERFRD